MNAFSDTMLSITRQFRVLRIRLAQVGCSARDRAEVAVASLRVFLQAHQSARAAGDDCFATVAVELLVGGRIFAVARPRGHENVPGGRKRDFPLRRTKGVLCVKGAAVLFASEPAFEAFVTAAADLLDAEVFEEDWKKRDEAPSAFDSAPPFDGDELELRRKSERCLPLMRHLEELAASVHFSGQQLRWVWLTRSVSPVRHPTGLGPVPFIFLHLPGVETTPWLMNPGGEKGIIHDVINTGAPSLIWNFCRDPKWNLPEDKKEEFKSHVDVDAHPHLLYVPVSGRLAGQICFGTGTNPVQILEQGEHLRAFASTAVSLAFRDAIYFHLARLPIDRRDLNFEQVRSGSREVAAVSQLLVDLCDVYPVEEVSPASPIPGEAQFRAATGLNGAAAPLVHGANAAAEQAWSTIWAMMDSQRWRDFSRTLLGINHTLDRPLDLMELFVGRVGSIDGLPEDIRENSRETRLLIKRLRVIRALEAKTLTILTHPSGSRPSGSRAEEVIAALENAGYFPPVADRSLVLLSCTDPLKGQPVAFECEPGASLRAPAAVVALMIAELVDNAAAFHQAEAADIAEEFGPGTTISVRLHEDLIIVSNPVPREHLDRAVARLNDYVENRPQRSAAKVKALAAMFGLDFQLLTPGQRAIEIRLVPHVTDRPKISTGAI